LVLLVFLLALILLPGAASAATYAVTRTDDPPPDGCLPTDCSLREALEASNASTEVDDVVTVPAGIAPYLVEFESKPLLITNRVEVAGAGADRVVIEGTYDGFVLVNEAAGTVLSGVTISHGAGGIESTAALTLQRVSVERNHGLGGIWSEGSLTIDSSFIGFNSSTREGGGVAGRNRVEVVDSTIAWNTSSSVGGISSFAPFGSTSLVIASSAVVFNRSTSNRGGVDATFFSFRDSIFAGNTNPNGVLNCEPDIKVRSLGGNVEDAHTCPTVYPPTANSPPDLRDVDPGLGTLGTHGGTTSVYDLIPGSPAIDAATQCPSLDQRGIARPQGAACDSGPYEFVPTPTRHVPGADKELFMRVGKKLRLGKNAIWVRLTCPKSEASPPCHGKAVVEDPPFVFHGSRPLQARPLYGRFAIGAGRTKAVALRRPRGTRRRLPNERGTWRVALRVDAMDAAGNSWSVVRRRALLVR